jgi:serine/threonine protein kinase
LVVSFLPFCFSSIAQLRAPEEFTSMETYEGIDTFSLGNNIYSLLTGLLPFYEYQSYSGTQVDSVIQDKLLRHERAYIDPRYRSRSSVENKLVEVMEQTWEFDPNGRISIFKVVQALREKVTANRALSKAGGE